MFVEKLNKKQDGVYVIEEEKDVANGIWEGYLDHDNVNHQTIAIYTGPKLTGEKIDNYFISTPSEMPWKTHIKAFSKSEKIYITYETTGDQVEADDINLVQDAIVDTIEDLSNYKSTNNADIQDLQEKANELERTKAAKTYVDTELNKKYNKEQVFTKEEVLQRIQDIIGAAPEALDTLEELARALDNDPNFATNIINLLSEKVDKVDGKGLSDENYTLAEKEKLITIDEGANKYTHPSTHSANIIVENENKRFVSDVEKTDWSNKWDYDENTIKNVKVNNAINADTVNGKTVEENVPSGASFTDTIYVHPKTHDADMILYFGIPITELIQQLNQNLQSKAEKSDIPTKVGQLLNDEGYLTNKDIEGLGGGDMTKAIYDKDSDGIVDEADIANSFRMIDTRSVNDTPSDLIARRTFGMFKYRSAVGNPPVGTTASYVFILNVIGWSVTEGSGGWPIQLAFGKEGIAYRIGVSNTEWSSWTKIANLNNIPTRLNQLQGPLTCNDLKGV